MTVNDNAKKLIAALRSGDYQQTKGRLHRTAPSREAEVGPEVQAAGYCCLGVACELFAQENPGELFRGPALNAEYEVFGETTAVLPAKVKAWLGFATSTGSFHAPRNPHGSLAGMNDYGNATFEQIADFIESEPAGLFTE